MSHLLHDATHDPLPVNHANAELRSKVDPRRPVRVLLIQMPFFRLTAPSISLATLEAALGQAGVSCDTEYLSLDFARRIGRERYGWIAVASPPYLLAGDLVFAPSLYGTPLGRDQVAELVAGLGTRAEAGVPEWFVTEIAELTAAAEDFLDHQLETISWQDYDLVGLSTICSLTPVLAIARRIKQLPHAPAIVLGGCNCDGEMGEHLHRAYPFLDFVCHGEGEQLLLELARSFAVGQPALAARPGLIWRQDGETRLDPRRASATLASDGQSPPGPFPLDALPIPRYERWLQQIGETGFFAASELQLPIATSRGCWYGEQRNCLFCGLNGEGITYRRKSSGRILEELEGLIGHGIKVFHCVDNILDPDYFEELLPRLRELDHGCELFWPVRPNLSRDQLALLQQSGVCWIQVGIESLSTSVLRLMNKGTTALQNVRLLRDAAGLGVGAAWNLLFGLPGEDPDAYRQIAELMPALAHLQPPRMSYRIRMDRFAPLHTQRRGVRDVAPAPAYRYVFPFEPREVERLAYYFEYDYEDRRDLAYVEGCLEAIASWRREVGRAALIGFDSGTTLQLCDSRRIATVRHVALRGLQREVLKATAQGIDRPALAARLDASPEELEAALRELQDRRWIVLLDGKLLSLVVAVDSLVPIGVPPLIVRDALEDLYLRRMRSLQEASSGLGPTATAGGPEAGETPCP